MRSFIKNLKFLIALTLFYSMCLLIIWDSTNQTESLMDIAITTFIALILSLILFIFRKQYEASMRIRFFSGVVLFVSYIIYGLSFRDMKSHMLFGMAMAIFSIIASFIVNLELEEKI